MQPLLLFSSWVQGFDCHDADLRKHGPQVQCQLKGCRARSIAKQVDTVLQQLRDIRQSLEADQLGDTATLFDAGYGTGNCWLRAQDAVGQYAALFRLAGHWLKCRTIGLIRFVYVSVV